MAEQNQGNPEIGKTVLAGGIKVNYHDYGKGDPVVLIHGREDEIIPTETSTTLFQLIPNAQLHRFGKCGHWTQIEQNERFVAVVEAFLEGAF